MTETLAASGGILRALERCVCITRQLHCTAYFIEKQEGFPLSRCFLTAAGVAFFAAPAFAQDVDPARSAEFVSALEAHGCVLTQSDTQNFVLSNGFADARETQGIVGALIAAGTARTEGANLILDSPNCASGAAQATPQPVPVPTPQPAPAPQPVPVQTPQPAPVPVPQATATLALCPSNALSLTDNIQCACPAGAATGSLWGTGIYTADSSICAAALHGGAISTNGGNINVFLSGRLEAFAGSSQNGVTSSEWGAYDRSFTVSPMQATAVPAPQPVPVPVPQTANACPTFEQMGQTYTMTGDQLYSPHSLTLQAGGSTDISGCNVGGVGFANAVPHLSIGLSGMEAYGRLEIEVDAQCDTTLLVNTPTAQWVFDDDSGGNLQPLLNLPSSASLNGRLDIWVGTYNGAACAATIELETWHG